MQLSPHQCCVDERRSKCCAVASQWVGNSCVPDLSLAGCCSLAMAVHGLQYTLQLAPSGTALAHTNHVSWLMRRSGAAANDIETPRGSKKPELQTVVRRGTLTATDLKAHFCAVT